MLTIYYRMCDVSSTNPSPVFNDDKFKLNMLCLKSFVSAFEGTRPHVVFIFDQCDDRYKKISEIVPFGHEFKFTNLGINGTCLLQYELASKVTGNVLFQECDYLYRPGVGKQFIKALNTFGLVSPYDHKNFYIDRSIHSDLCHIELVDNHHWRTTERNTMTFAMSSDNVRRLYSILTKWGYLDSEVWHEMRREGLPLWVPIPGMATHMVNDWLSPGVDWEEIWKTLT